MMLTDELKKTEGKLLIYGAHLVALECCRFLIDYGKGSCIVGFAVTNKEDNPEELEGYQVEEIHAYIEQCKLLTVVIAMPKKYHDVVESYAQGKGFRKFIKVGLEEMSVLKSRQMLEEQQKWSGLTFHMEENVHDRSWLDIRAAEMTQQTYFKFPTLFYRKTEDVFKEVSKTAFLEASQEVLGQYRNLCLISEKLVMKAERPISDILQIYMVFSRYDSASISIKEYAPWIYPLQAGGRNSKQEISCLYDDTGETIADKNSVFAEMTGAYWIWKNRNWAAYKGLCHYRRHFIISEEKIRTLEQNGIDVILTIPRYIPYGVGNMFLAETPVKKELYEIMIYAVQECAPEDVLMFKAYLESCFYYPNNMVIARNEIYNAYCEWIFKILFRISDIDARREHGNRNDRHIAYAAELLTSFYFVKNRDVYRIAVTDYQFYT